MYYESKNYLAHHGIKDQKWHNRRFQNYDGSLTPEGRIRYGVGSPREKKKEESNANSRLKETVRKQRSKKEAIKKQKEIDSAKAKEKIKDEEHEMLKKHILEHPKAIYKHRSEFTKSEIEELISKINYNRKIEDIKIEETKRGWEKIQRFSNNVETIANLTKSGANIAKNVIDVHNALVTAGAIDGKIIPSVQDYKNKQKQQNQNQQQKQNQKKK